MATSTDTLRWLCGSYRYLAKRLESIEMQLKPKHQRYHLSSKDVDAAPFYPHLPPGVHYHISAAADANFAAAIMQVAEMDDTGALVSTTGVYENEALHRVEAARDFELPEALDSEDMQSLDKLMQPTVINNDKQYEHGDCKKLTIDADASDFSLHQCIDHASSEAFADDDVDMQKAIAASFVKPSSSAASSSSLVPPVINGEKKKKQQKQKKKERCSPPCSDPMSLDRVKNLIENIFAKHNVIPGVDPSTAEPFSSIVADTLMRKFKDNVPALLNEICKKWEHEPFFPEPLEVPVETSGAIQLCLDFLSDQKAP